MRAIFFIPSIIAFHNFAQQLQPTDTLRAIETQSVSIIALQNKFVGGSGTRLSATQLQKLNQNDVNKVLRSVPGVQIRDEEGFGLRPNIGLRGTPVNRSAKITVMEDGILMAPAAYSDPSAYYFPTFARMGGVEVLKGSSQIKHGPYTIGGAINLLSTNIPAGFKALAHVSYGSFNMNQQRFWVGDSKGQLSYLFEVNRIASTGFKEIDGGGNTGFDRRDFLGKIRWQSKNSVKVKQSVQLKMLHVEEQANETYLGLTYTDFMQNPLRRYAGTQKDLLNLFHNHVVLQHVIKPLKNLDITSSAYITQTFRDWGRANSFGTKSIASILSNPAAEQTAYQIMTGQANGEIIYRSASRLYITKGLQTHAHYYLETKNIKHDIEVGLRLHQDEASRYGTQSKYQMTNGLMILSDAGEQGNQENQIRSAWSAATYLSYQLTWHNFTLNTGLRREQIQLEYLNYGTSDFARTGSNLATATNSFAIWLPGASLYYEANKNNLFFFGAHKGFSPPGMPSTSSTEQAKPELAINYELGYRLLTKTTQIQAVLFKSAYENLLGSDNISGGGMGTGDLFNAGKALVQGAELSIQQIFQYKKWRFPIQANYTFTKATFEETFVNGGGDWGSGQINKNDLIPFITPHLFGCQIGVENHKWTALLNANYIGATRTLPGQNENIDPTSDENYALVNNIPGFVILDLSLQYEMQPSWKIFANVQNLTNNQNIVANLPQGYRPALPRALLVGFKMQL